MNTKEKENDEQLAAIVRGWQKLEERAISHSYDLMRRSQNSFTKMITDLVIHDSEKHRLVQQMIINLLAGEAFHISPEELNELFGMINRHMAAEEEALRLAEAALEKCRSVSTHFLLSYLIADEKKHHTLVSRMEELSLAAIPASGAARPMPIS